MYVLIIKNRTATTLTYLSGAIVVPGSGEFTVPSNYYFDLVTDAQFRYDISTGAKADVNDGVTNYGNTDALEYIDSILQTVLPSYTAVFAHVAESDPHTQYLKESDAATTYAPVSHTHPLSQITQSGATTGQIPKWNGSTWIPADESGGGSSSGDINDGGNVTADTLVIGTQSNEDVEFITNNTMKMHVDKNGDVTVGTTPDGTSKLMVYEQSDGTATRTGLRSLLFLTDPGAGGADPQMGIFCIVRANHNTGTYTLLRNYFMAEMTGDGVTTEMYGLRALTTTRDLNQPGGDTCSGTVQNQYGLEAYANNTSTAGKVRRATGIVISSARATGTDAGNNHTARGLWIQDAIEASGGDVNEAFAMDITSTALSRFFGELLIENGKTLSLKGTSGAGKIKFKAPDGMSSDVQFTWPSALPGAGLTKIFSVDENGIISLVDSGGGGSGDVTFGGNTVGAAKTIGSIDNYDINLKTNNTERIYIKNSGEVTVGRALGDFGSQPVNFGAMKFDTVDSTKPFSNFENYFAYYGNSFNSRNGTLFTLALRPGEPEFTYSGEYIALNASAFLQTAGVATSVIGFKNIVSCLNSNGRVADGVAAIFGVETFAGIVTNARGVQIQTVEAKGTTTAEHLAVGIDIGNNGNGIVASGSSVNNKAVGLRIGNSISGTQESIAIESNSTAKSDFQGPMNMFKGVRIATETGLPTAGSDYRGTQWVVQGGSGVADALYICLKDAADAYNWVQLN